MSLFYPHLISTKRRHIHSFDYVSYTGHNRTTESKMCRCGYRQAKISKKQMEAKPRNGALPSSNIYFPRKKA